MTEQSAQELADYKILAGTLSEAAIYIMITSLMETLAEGKKVYNEGYWGGTEEEYQEGLEFFTACFDINLDELPKFGVARDNEADREKWLAHWKAWDDALSDEVRNVIDVKLANSENVDEYMPIKHWNEV
jgi:hypothetical protein